MRRPVYISGRGAVTGFGRGVRALCDGVFGGEAALRPRDRTAGVQVNTAVCGEFPPGTLGDSAMPERDLPLRAALLATEEALDEAGRPDMSPLVVDRKRVL